MNKWCSLFIYHYLLFSLSFLASFLPSYGKLFLWLVMCASVCVCVCMCAHLRHKKLIALLAMGAADRGWMKESYTWNHPLGALNSGARAREARNFRESLEFQKRFYLWAPALVSRLMRKLLRRMSRSPLGSRKKVPTTCLLHFSCFFFFCCCSFFCVLYLFLAERFG